MGRATRPPPKPKPKYLFETPVTHHGVKWTTHQAELWAEVARIAGHAGFRKHSFFWAITVVGFDTAEKAQELRQWLRAQRFEEGRPHQGRPEPTRYEVASTAQHAVAWGLVTGLLKPVVRAYRAERSEASTHGHPIGRPPS